MERTRKSFWFPASYLLSGGLGLMVMPDLALKMMLSNGSYGPVFPRLAGVLICGLGGIVVQVIRHKAEALYPSIIGVRVFFCAGWLALYFFSGDPFFLFLLGLVGFGTVLSFVQYRRDRSGVGRQ